MFTDINENTVFTLNVNSTNGCDLSTSFTTEACEEELSLIENDSISFSVSPNPASSFIEVNSGLVGEKDIHVYELSEKPVLKSQQDHIDITELKSGIYLIEISQEGSKSIKRIIVQ